VDDPDAALLSALRAGEEAAFAELVDRYHARLVRAAEAFVGRRAVAEEVAQETWLGVVRGIDRFEGRSSFKTWLFRILANRARTAGAREARLVPVGDDAVELHLAGRRDGRRSRPPPWSDGSDARLLAGSLVGAVRDVLPQLPPAQRRVLTLRDLEGADAVAVCELLKISAVNQRVLLHRARTRVRVLLGPRSRQARIDSATMRYYVE
jgi:RNA polymerase sigma-70 factor, ECF subfamily